MVRILKYGVISAFLFIQFAVFSQDPQIDTLIISTKDTVIITPIPLTEINSEVEKLSQRVSNIANKMVPDPKILLIDSQVIVAKILVDKRKQHISDIEEFISIKNIEDLKKEWLAYKEKYNTWKSEVVNRTDWFEKQLDFVHTQNTRWKLTKAALINDKAPAEVIELANLTKKRFKTLEKDLIKNQSNLFVIQNGITELLLDVDKVMSDLNAMLLDLQSQIFIKDSPFLWEVSDTTVVISRLRRELEESMKENVRVISVFFPQNQSNSIAHLLLIISLIIVLFVLKRRVVLLNLPENDKRYENAKYITYHYISTALLIGFLSTSWMYSKIPTSIQQLTILLMLFPTVFLLPLIAKQKFKHLLLVILILFLINEILFFYQLKLVIIRFFLIFENLILTWIIYKIIRYNRKERSLIISRWWKSFIRLSYISIFLLLTSAISNLFGFMNLASLLNKMVISGLLYAIVLSLLVIIINSTILILIRTETFQKSKIIFKYGQLVEKRIIKFIQYFMVYIWIRAILKSSGFISNVYSWIIEALTKERSLGTTSFEIGNLLSFFLVLFITYVLAKSIKLILEEEIYPRINLPRGVPGAISMLTGYLLVAAGIFVSLSAAGVDLGKFSLMAGALSVGIGFGLQNVVYNFISGLILAFERPIQVGDTVEVGILMGTVKHIGVRSSTVRTFDGSEVIVPNGNLISNELVNWSLSDKRRRREVKVGVAYGAHPQDVLDLLAKVADSHDKVLKVPKPLCLFDSFGDFSMNFRLLFWVPLDSGLSIQSEVTMNLYKAIKEAGMEIPYPQHDLHIKSFDPTIQKTVYPKFINTDKKED